MKPLTLIKEIDYGTPASKSENMVTLTIDGVDVTVPEGTSIMRAAMEMGTDIPKLCATDMLDSFGSCRLCLVEIEGRNGTPASCTTPVAPGISVKTQTPRLEADPQGRDGALHLRPSARLLDLRRPTATANWKIWRVPSACAMCATATRARTTCSPSSDGKANDALLAKDESNPYFTYDRLEVHRLQSLRARLRRSAGHVCADDLGPWL